MNGDQVCAMCGVAGCLLLGSHQETPPVVWFDHAGPRTEGWVEFWPRWTFLAIGLLDSRPRLAGGVWFLWNWRSNTEMVVSAQWCTVYT